MVFTCCVPSCKNSNKDAQMHIFPKEKPLYDIWIEKVGRNDLRDKPMKQVRMSYRMCHIHFGPEALYVGSRYKSTIRKDAIPSLYLDVHANEVLESRPPVEIVPMEEEIPCSSKDMPSTSQMSDVNVSPRRSQEKPSPKAICTPAKSSYLHKRSNLLAYTNTAKASDLTPKARKLYKIASGLRKTARRLNFSRFDLKKKVKHLQSKAYTQSFLQANLNKPTFDFLMSQLRCQRVKAKGRRYTLDEKILFLSLMKQSAKSYRLLRKLFAIPSRKTLTNLLGKIPFHSGINKSIMNSLKSKVRAMTDLQLCV